MRYIGSAFLLIGITITVVTSAIGLPALNHSSRDLQASRDAVIVDSDAAMALAVGLPIDKDPLIQPGPQGYAELVLDIAKYPDIKVGGDSIGALLTATRAKELLEANAARAPHERLRIAQLPSKDSLRYVITSDDMEQAAADYQNEENENRSALGLPPQR